MKVAADAARLSHTKVRSRGEKSDLLTSLEVLTEKAFKLGHAPPRVDHRLRVRAFVRRIDPDDMPDVSAARTRRRTERGEKRWSHRRRRNQSITCQLELLGIDRRPSVLRRTLLRDHPTKFKPDSADKQSLAVPEHAERRHARRSCRSTKRARSLREENAPPSPRSGNCRCKPGRPPRRRRTRRPRPQSVGSSRDERHEDRHTMSRTPSMSQLSQEASRRTSCGQSQHLPSIRSTTFAFETELIISRFSFPQ